MSLIEQLPEPFKNNEEENHEEYLQINQQINNQVNQQTNQQLNNNIETSNNVRQSTCNVRFLLYCAIFLVSIEAIFFTLCLFALLNRNYP